MALFMTGDVTTELAVRACIATDEVVCAFKGLSGTVVLEKTSTVVSSVMNVLVDLV